MFASDRDLLVLEPALFDQVRWTGQTLVDGASAALAADGVTVVLTGFDPAAAGVRAGGVIKLGDAAWAEIIEVDGSLLTVSKLRANVSDGAIPLALSAGTYAAVVSSFLPQIAMVHDVVRSGLGVLAGERPTDDDAAPTGAAYESDVVNGRELARLEALGALHLIFAAAATVTSDDSPVWAKAMAYRDRFARERQRVRAQIDVNGDGVAEFTRGVNPVRLVAAARA